MPLSAVKAMRDLISIMENSNSFLKRLEKALSQTSLAFPVRVPEDKRTSEEIKEAEKFQRRLVKLRMRAEESRYIGLTKNLDNTVEDDVTTRSMTYAASVGLNMIVAPISFGVFVYFFAGATLFKANPNLRPGETDVRKVIAGVVSGVGMLFVEMILFVIRSHEFDASITKKKKTKKKTHGAFGNKENKRDFH